VFIWSLEPKSDFILNLEIYWSRVHLSATSSPCAAAHTSGIVSHLEHMPRTAALSAIFLLSPVRTALPHSASLAHATDAATVTCHPDDAHVVPRTPSKAGFAVLPVSASAHANVLHLRPFRRATSSPPLPYSSLGQDLAEPPSPSRRRPQRSALATFPASRATPRSQTEDSRRRPKLRTGHRPRRS
jgi:hypothetical protein